MRNIFLLLLLSIIIFFIPQNIYGQDISVFDINSLKDNVPGVTCGVANDVTGKDKCCNLPKVVNCDGPIVKIASWSANLSAIIPGAGFFADYVNNGISNCTIVDNYISQQNKDTSCISGEATSVTEFVRTGQSGTQVTSCKCIDKTNTDPNSAITKMCAQYLSLSSASLNELKNCLSCAGTNGIWTGMGCLPLDLNTLITSFVLTTGIGIGGGFALLCIIYAAFMMQSSQGNPEKLKKSQEMITSCIMGLMLIIFSVFIMKLIGVNILRIPGFG